LRKIVLQHFSDKPLFLNQLYNVEHQEPDQEDVRPPTGLWASVKGRDDWLHWCKERRYERDRPKYTICNTLEVDYSRILIINTEEKFRDFCGKYHGIIIKGEYLWYGLHQRISWEKVSQDFDGIITAPYFPYFSSYVPWYAWWDQCACGCIWNAKDAIKKITREEKPGLFLDKPIKDWVKNTHDDLSRVS
jgi:hypothetical protein